MTEFELARAYDTVNVLRIRNASRDALTQDDLA